MMLDGDENQNNLEVTAVYVPEEGRQATGDKLHADAEGDDILVGRDGQEQKPHRPATLSCTIVVQWFEYLVLSVRPMAMPSNTACREMASTTRKPRRAAWRRECSGECGGNGKRGKNGRRVDNTSKPPPAVIFVGMLWEWPYPAPFNISLSSFAPFSLCLLAGLNLLSNTWVTCNWM